MSHRNSLPFLLHALLSLFSQIKTTLNRGYSSYSPFESLLRKCIPPLPLLNGGLLHAHTSLHYLIALRSGADDDAKEVAAEPLGPQAHRVWSRAAHHVRQVWLRWYDLV